MEIVLWIIAGLVGYAFISSLLSFACQRPFTIVLAFILGISIGPIDNFVPLTAFFILLFWLFTTRDGLITISSLFLGFILAVKQK